MCSISPAGTSICEAAIFAASAIPKRPALPSSNSADVSSETAFTLSVAVEAECCDRCACRSTRRDAVEMLGLPSLLRPSFAPNGFGPVLLTGRPRSTRRRCWYLIR